MTWTTAGPPPTVPGFLIGARLGVGSTGSVWRAMAATGGPEVAIKVVRASPDAEREVAVLRAVSHPHVVRLHQAVVLDDGRLALVLGLVDGPTLAAVVAQRGHLSPGEVVTLIVPLAQAGTPPSPAAHPKLNEEVFPALTAKFVRFTIHDANLHPATS